MNTYKVYGKPMVNNFAGEYILIDIVKANNKDNAIYKVMFVLDKEYYLDSLFALEVK